VVTLNLSKESPCITSCQHLSCCICICYHLSCFRLAWCSGIDNKIRIEGLKANETLWYYIQPFFTRMISVTKNRIIITYTTLCQWLDVVCNLKQGDLIICLQSNMETQRSTEWQILIHLYITTETIAIWYAEQFYFYYTSAHGSGRRYYILLLKFLSFSFAKGSLRWHYRQGTFLAQKVGYRCNFIKLVRNLGPTPRVKFGGPKTPNFGQFSDDLRLRRSTAPERNEISPI